MTASGQVSDGTARQNGAAVSGRAVVDVLMRLVEDVESGVADVQVVLGVVDDDCQSVSPASPTSGASSMIPSVSCADGSSKVATAGTSAS